MDSSDGLANAVLWLCQASGVGARLQRSRLPIPLTLSPWVGDETALEWCLYGGEDFELVLCLPAETALELLTVLDERATHPTLPSPGRAASSIFSQLPKRIQCRLIEGCPTIALPKR